MCAFQQRSIFVTSSSESGGGIQVEAIERNRYTAMKKQIALPTMQEPAIYRIRVRGHIDAKWSERLEAMNITEVQRSDRENETILVGRLADQAALAGVLNTLYEQHLPVLSVDCLEEG